jgi:hypothetical protein
LYYLFVRCVRGAPTGETKMFNTYEEHIRDSQFDDSRFAGFDRGDTPEILPANAFDGEWEDIEF